MTSQLYHVALASDWAQARERGTYPMSTRGARIDQIGFLHACADLDQVAGVARRFYSDVAEPMVLLSISTAALSRHGLRVLFEPGVPGDPDAELFPHVYGGELPLDAVVDVSSYPSNDAPTAD